MKSLIITVVTLGTSAASLAAQPASFSDTYGVLNSMNMFLRDRQPPRTREPRPRSPSVNWNDPAVVERTVVLRGVTIEDDGAHAYAENTHTGQILRLSVGDAIANGKVGDIAIDAIAYEVNGKSAWVNVGQNLSGARMADGAPASQPAQTYTPTKPGAPAALPPGGGSLEERMKARRAAMQNKK